MKKNFTAAEMIEIQCTLEGC